MVKILSKTVETDDYPVCVASFAGLKRWLRLSNDGFLSERNSSFSEAGDLRLHNRTVPLHFLVISTSSISWYEP